MQWFYVRNGERFGPVEEDDLRERARIGQLCPADLVWNPSMGQAWQPASSVPGFFNAPAVPAPAGRNGLTPNARLMELARQSLAGCWGVAVGAALLNGLISNSFNVAAEFGSVAWKAMATALQLAISLFITGPLLLGWHRLFLQIARREKPDLNRFFDGFRLFWKCVGTSWLVGLFILLASLPVLLPAVAVPILSRTLGFSLASVPAVMLFLLLLVPFLIPAMLVALNYSLVFFVLSDQPELPVSAVLGRSRELMYGFRWKYACLGCRFIGWVLLAIFTCGIGLLWLQPYITVSNAHFYEDVRT